MQARPSTAADAADTSDQSDALINSAEAKRLAADISGMTLWRWERAGIIPPAIVIRNRKYWRRLSYLAALESAGSTKDREGA